MATNTINARVKHKIGTADEWQTAATNSSFKPLEGELIIYEDATTPRLKVGDGSKLVTELPFIDGIKVTVSGSGNAITAASYDENTRTLTLTKGASYTNNTGDITGVTAGNGLTGGGSSGGVTLNVGAGSGITVAADTVSVNTGYTTSGKNYKVAVDSTSGGLYVNVPWTDNNTDTGATSVEVTGSGNAITGASYDPSTRKLTLTKGSTFSNNSGDITGVTAGSGLTGGATSGTATLNVGQGSGIIVNDDTVAVNTNYTTSGKNYKVAVDSTSGGLYVNVPWTDNNTTSFTITASASDDDVVNLTGTNGTNKVTYTASHAKKGPSSGYTSSNTTTSISGAGSEATIKIPQLTVDSYGHVTAAADESVTIKIPSVSDLGLSGAMRFLGTSATAITDGATTNPITIGSTSTTVSSGNVVLYGNKEFVWNGSKWEELGNEGSYKVQQTAVSSPSTSGSTTAFIDTISQNAQGVITATKKNVSFPSITGGSAAANDATVVGGVTVSGHAVTVGKKTLTAGNNVSITGGTNTITIAATDTTYDAATQSTAGLMSADDKKKLDGIASGATANTGDITGVTAGVGIAGGATSGTATVKAKLRSETALTVDSAAATTTSGRVYPVAVDKTGYLAVNVPWTDSNTNYYHTRAYSSGLQISTGTGVSNMYVPYATTSAYGVIKVGDNISVSSGVISLSKANVVAALGYTPPTTDTNTNTTYDFSASTSSTNGNVKLNLVAGGSGSGTDSVTIKGTGATTVTTDSSGVVTINTGASSVTLNGSATTSASFYAPTSAGTANQILASNGSGAPKWINQTTYTLSGLGGIGSITFAGKALTVSGTSASISQADARSALGLGSNAYSSTAYLPLTGGTLTGQLNTCSIMAGSSSSNTAYTSNVSRLGSDGTTIGRIRTMVAATAESGIIDFLSNGTSVNSLTIKANGESVFSGQLASGNFAVRSNSYPSIYLTNSAGTQAHLQLYANTSSSSVAAGVVFRVWSATSTYSDAVTIANTGKLYGAVWNDYAEYREQMEDIKPGYIAYCDDDGKLKLTTERLQKFEGVVSDTYGFAIGKNERNKTPIAVSGRALVYANPDEEFHSGDCVCAGPNGLAYRMTEEEIIKHPNRIVGVVSEIPTYETWGETPIEVNGRIWIKVK